MTSRRSGICTRLQQTADNTTLNAKNPAKTHSHGKTGQAKGSAGTKKTVDKWLDLIDVQQGVFELSQSTLGWSTLDQAWRLLPGG